MNNCYGRGGGHTEKRKTFNWQTIFKFRVRLFILWILENVDKVIWLDSK